MANRQLGGLKAKRNGQKSEKIIEQSCIYYAKKGIANIDKTPEPMQVIRPVHRGVYQAVFTKSAQPDFTGTLAGGQSVMFEAKNTDTTNIKFERITYAQETYLDAHQELGAHCFVLVSFKMQTFYAVPWKRWQWLKYHIEKKSINEKDIFEYKCTRKGSTVLFLTNYLKKRDELDDQQG